MAEDNTKKISLLAVSFSQGFIKPNIPIATFYQGNKELTFVLDSGSNDNVIDQNILDKITHSIKEEEGETTLSGLEGPQKVKICTIPFSTKDTSYTADFLISNLKDAFKGTKEQCGIQLHGMLGSNFFKKYNMVIDFTTLSAYSKE